jgi:PAS domain S-box-containing protein
MADVVRILIIEDDQHDSELIRRQILKVSADFTFETTDNKTDYLKFLETLLPDLIISDYTLPQFSGMEALEIRNGLDYYVPFILVTGSINEEVAVECIKAGADDYILKHNLSRLGHAVNSALKKAEIIRSKDKAEKALKETENIFSAFLEHSPVYIFFKDAEIRSVRLSRNFEKMLGMPLENALGKSMDELFPSDMSKSMIRDDQKVLKDNRQLKVVEELDGRIFETTKFPIIKGDGSRMLAGFTLDITDRINAEKALSLSKKEFQNYFEKSAVGLSVTDINMKWTQVNSKFCSMVGYSREELLGMSWIDLSHPDELEENLRLFQSSLDGKRDFYELDKKLYRKDRSVIHVNLSVVCQRKDDGSVDHFLASYVDITERKKYEKDLIHAKEKAEESDRLKTAFLHNVTHEIRTPMNAISGFSSILKNDPGLGDEQKEYADIIIRSSEHLLSVVDNIIDISNIEAGIIRLDEKYHNINKIMSDIYVQLSPVALNKALDLRYCRKLSDDYGEILVDGTKLTQIIINLVNNALKYTEKGFVEFGVEGQQEDKLEFFVTDTGIGIPEEAQKRIFDRFYQVDSGSTRRHDGLGLGLSITQSFIEKMGGRIWLTSRKNEGSEFRFTIPYRPKKSGKSSLNNNSSGKMENSEKLILVAEDDPANFVLMKFNLKLPGVRLLHVENGKDAVDACKENKSIDLVLMDIKMPFMDGLEATRQIKIFRKDLKIIAVTAYAFDGDYEAAMEAGCDDYVVKPVRKDNLLSVINKYLKITD